MYLHLGQDVVVRKRDILGVFDLDNASLSQITRAFLLSAQEAGKVEDVSGALPRSFVVAADEEGSRIFLSQITTATLLKRFEDNGFD